MEIDKRSDKKETSQAEHQHVDKGFAVRNWLLGINFKALISHPKNAGAKTRMPHSFEFMDLPFLSTSLRNVLREILDLGNSLPFRTYYNWVAKETVTTATRNGIGTIYELGAGTGPICRHILTTQTNSLKDIVLRPCDINPDVDGYRALHHKFGAKVSPILEPVDFTVARDWSESKPKEKVLLLFSANLHHLKSETRVSVLKKLLPTCDLIIIAEPLHKSITSLLFVLFSLIPALLLPLALISKMGRMKRFLWCWFLPLAPLLFVWDGIISAIRQWNPRQRNHVLFEELDLMEDDVTIKRTFFSELIVIKGRKNNNSEVGSFKNH